MRNLFLVKVSTWVLLLLNIASTSTSSIDLNIGLLVNNISETAIETGGSKVTEVLSNEGNKVKDQVFETLKDARDEEPFHKETLKVNSSEFKDKKTAQIQKQDVNDELSKMLRNEMNIKVPIDWTELFQGREGDVEKNYSTKIATGWEFADRYRIDGFKLTKPEDNPYSVALSQVTKDGKFVNVCSGTLLTMEWVLSAAHCFVSRRDKPFTHVVIYAGGNGVRDLHRQIFPKGSQLRYAPAQSIYSHPDQNYKPKYDVALAKTERRFDRTKYVSDIKLSQGPWRFPGYRTCKFTGFGRIQLQEENIDDYRRKTNTLEVKTPCKCYEKSWNYDKVICSKPKEDFGGCSGDSGSGLICDAEVYGITSAIVFFQNIDTCTQNTKVNERCGMKNSLTLFAPASLSLQWIKSKIDTRKISASVNASSGLKPCLNVLGLQFYLITLIIVRNT